MENEHGMDPTPEINNADGGDQNNNAGGVADLDSGAGGDKGAADPNLKIGGADGGQLSVYKPDGLAAHLVGQTDQETIDRLLTENKGYRDAQAKGTPKADDYKFEWGESVKGSIAEDDQAVKIFREIAQEHGFSQKQIDAIPKFFDLLAEKGLIEKPFDHNAVLEGLAPAEFKGSSLEKQAEGGKRMTQASNWIDQLQPGTGFDDAMKGELKLLTTSVDGVRVIEQLRKMGSNPGFNPGGGSDRQQAVTEKELEQRIADPRNDSTNYEKFDPDFAKKTSEMFQQFYGA